MKEYIDLSQYGDDTKNRKHYTVAESFCHPAKMSWALTCWIIDNYCDPKKSEVILDPMAGVGSTLVVGMMRRPQSIWLGVEFEGKFTELCQANIRKVEKIAEENMFMEVGKSVVIQGDARSLEGVVDKIISSPPFTSHQEASPQILKEKYRKSWAEKVSKRNLGNVKDYGSVDKIITSPPFAEAQSGGGIAKKGYQDSKHSLIDLVGKRSYMPENVGDKDNIGNLKYGQVNKIISSPPFADTEAIKRLPNTLTSSGGQTNYNHQSTSNNISNLKYGQVNKIGTSPPYSGTGIGDWKTGRDEFQEWVKNELATKGYIEWQGKRYIEKEWRAMNHGRLDGRTTKGVHKHPTDGYSKDPNNLGNLPAGKIDKIISSPPYEDKKIQSDFCPPHDTTKLHHSDYAPSPDNIGNTKGKTYLGEMLRVYREYWKVLVPGGLCILVLKDFIRKGERIPLGEHTVELCKKAGFTHIGTHYRKIGNLSFWRILQVQKYGEKYRIDHEDILVFRK